MAVPRFGVVLIAIAFAQASPQPPQRLAPDSARRALAEYLRRAESQGLSGAFFMAVGDDVLVHHAMGWRDPSSRVPNDTSTLFYIASIAKQFVAAGILKLEDEGRLRTTDSLGKFFPEAPSDKRSITLDQLLSHTSGLGRYGFDVARRDWAIEDRETGISGILATPVAIAAGKQFSYQNVNYLFLAEVIERVTRQPFDVYLDSRLIQPARLHDTFIGSRVTDALRPRVAWSLGDETETFSILDRKPSWLWHGRGVLMTAGDLARWAQAIHRGTVLSAHARRKLFAIGATLGTRYGYAAGWFVRVDSAGAPRVAFHGGDFGSYHAEVRLYPPSGTVIVALTNVSNRGRSLTETVLNQMIDVSRGGPNPFPAVMPRSNSTPALSGDYRASKTEALSVRERGTSLVVSAGGQQAVDWLLRGDTSGWQERGAAARRSMMLVDALNRRVLQSLSGVAPVPDELRRNIEDEWATLVRAGGQLKSYQLLGVVRSADDAGHVGIVRLKFARDSLLYGVGWSGDTLRYTSVGIQNLVAPLVFARTSATEWASYDWVSERARRLTVRTLPNGGVTLTLETTNGPISFRSAPRERRSLD
jgi:CubicO group peptidase (beta-lactamase class C family)